MDYSNYQELTVATQDSIAVVTLNRPELLNAVSHDLHAELEQLWIDIAHDGDIRAVVLTGAGRAFSAGGNVKSMLDRFGTEDGWKKMKDVGLRSRDLLRNMLDVPQPIVAAVNGDAMGVGATLALATDISVMSGSARIGDTHVKMGLVAGDGGAVLWPLLIGTAKAKECLMLGRILNGEYAERIGLVNYAVPAAEVLGKAMELAQELVSLPPLAVQWTKKAASMHIKEQFNTAFEVGASLEMLSFLTKDHEEAARAFVEKRKGSFRGR